MNIRKQINHWASLVKESLGEDYTSSENSSSHEKEIAEYTDFLESIVKSDPSLNFVVLRDIDRFCEEKTLGKISDSVTDESTIQNVAKDKIEEISEEPEKYGIEYRDDSDYSDEGYGPYGEYDEDEIRDVAREEATDEMFGIKQRLEDYETLKNAVEGFKSASPESKDEIVAYFEKNPICTINDDRDYPIWSVVIG